jgi:hypothetical protein
LCQDIICGIKNNAALNIFISLICYIIYKSSVLQRRHILNRNLNTCLLFLKRKLIFRNEIYQRTRMALTFKVSSYINRAHQPIYHQPIHRHKFIFLFFHTTWILNVKYSSKLNTVNFLKYILKVWKPSQRMVLQTHIYSYVLRIRVKNMCLINAICVICICLFDLYPCFHD